MLLILYNLKVNIKFIPSSKETELIVPHPKPAKTYIPEWYKSIRLQKEEDSRGVSNSIKRCMPFLDGLTSGYIQETWTDIYIEKNNENVNYHYPIGPDILSIRDNVSIDISDLYYPIEFVWKILWFPKLPNGWSVFITSPANRLDLPFRSLDAVIDSDSFYHSPAGGGNYPFYLNKDFQGIIPAGTPMYQMIPFKRELWESSAEEFNADDFLRRMAKVKKHIFNSYKNNFWNKKDYR